jgi:hypothetical protein
MRLEAKIGLVSLSVIGIAAACGGRSGTEIFGYDDVLLDASAGGAGGSGGYGGGIVEGGPGGTSGGSGGGTAGTGGVLPDGSVEDVSEDGKPPPDAGPDGMDLFDVLPPFPEGGPIGECVGCLQSQCGTEINACYNDPTCVAGIQCTVTDCLVGGGSGGGSGAGGGGGQIDFACILGCFDNDFGSAMTAVSAFTCITQNCADDCGLGGGGGAGGGGGGAAYGIPVPDGLFSRPSMYRPDYYIGSTRVPRPEEVASAYPWLAELLAGRMPDPPPPCMANKKK